MLAIVMRYTGGAPGDSIDACAEHSSTGTSQSTGGTAGHSAPHTSQAAVVVLLGAVPWAVVAFEVLLNAASVFNHGNVMLPEHHDRWLRWFVVTPDMHRVHHSTRMVETNTNFGFSVSWWDRLCGTYRAQPAFGQVGMDIGLSDYRTPLHLGQLLLLPFHDSTGCSTNAGTHAAALQGRDAA